MITIKSVSENTDYTYVPIDVYKNIVFSRFQKCFYEVIDCPVCPSAAGRVSVKDERSEGCVGRVELCRCRTGDMQENRMKNKGNTQHSIISTQNFRWVKSLI